MSSNAGRVRNLKLPRSKLPEPLANALRLFGYNWEGMRSRNGKLWRIYRQPIGPMSVGSWTLHADAEPAEVVKWLELKERGLPAPDGKLLVAS